MITANVIHRVFQIRFGAGTGTIFAIDVAGKQYLITAKHVVPGIADNSTISLYSNHHWLDVVVDVVGVANDPIDVTVLRANRQLTPHNNLELPSTDSVNYGQDVYFLGFPYGLVSDWNFGPDGFPLPWVKRAIVSQFNENVWLLDGHNNPGFSGGPVVFKPAGTQQFSVGAVISGYRSTREPVYLGQDASPLQVNYNTGIIISYPISDALDLINANPTGFPLPVHAG